MTSRLRFESKTPLFHAPTIAEQPVAPQTWEKPCEQAQTSFSTVFGI
jgi:hypothetical protein